MNDGFKELKVFQLAYKLAMDIFEITKAYPPEERYSLTDQIRRSSRSVCVNIAEGYRKRSYPKHFILRLTDADSECSETKVWLDFSNDCNYISDEQHRNFHDRYAEVGKMLGFMILNPEKFMSGTNTQSFN
jgi:four helix bundle protein